MNLNKLTLITAIALASVALPVSSLQAQRHGGGGRTSAASPSGGMQHGSVGGASRSIGHGTSRWTGNGTSHWNGNRGGNWHHHRYYPRSYGYYGFGYPYYGFGYGYPYGYGFGSPYYGASASLYYNGYGRGSDRRGESLGVEVQQRLARAGYYHGSIDGIVGSGTRRAIRAYERSHGLPVDGLIDDQLLERMGLT